VKHSSESTLDGWDDLEDGRSEVVAEINWGVRHVKLTCESLVRLDADTRHRRVHVRLNSISMSMTVPF
jgi:hypothetical protein